MTEPASEFAGVASDLRQAMIGVLDAMRRDVVKFDLPGLPEAVDTCLSRLRQESFEVLVVGELKRGKSSFVNALIGADLLPTDVDVATSQVFRVSQAPTPVARIVFEDGRTHEIELTELPRYGSQVVADAEGEPAPDQIIRWIEVDYPTQFLPPPIHLLDTPGVGSLYAGHAAITERFVPHADAVVFVLDSLEPIKAEEVAFVESILDVTPHAFFIQTKIDIVGRDAWQEMLARNERILAETFGERLKNRRIWPISSRLLHKAGRADKHADAYRLQSKQPELVEALLAFLEDATLWSRVAESYLVADQAHLSARRTLAARYKALSEDPQAVRARLQRQASERLAQFDAEWGERGTRMRKLHEDLCHRITLAQQGLERALQRDGTIADEFKDEIESLTDRQAASQYAEELGPRLVARVGREWRLARRSTVEHCAELLRAFCEALEAPTVGARESESDESLPELRARLKARGSLWDKMKGSMGEMRMVGGVSLVLGLSGVLATSPLLAPLLAGGGAIAAFLGWRQVEKRTIEEMRNDLGGNVDQMLLRLRRWLFYPDLAANTSGRVEEQFQRMEASIREDLQNLAQKKRQDTQAEIDRMMAEADLDPERRNAKAQETRQQLAAWNDIGQTLKAVQEQLERARPMPAPPPT